MQIQKLDRRRKYYLVLDCETATLPFISDFSPVDGKTISIAKPLIYDLGWQIIDNKGNVYKRESFLISEIFSVPHIFNTAYYASKRPLYLEKLSKGEISLVPWTVAANELVDDMDSVYAVGAFNSMFDFKKALPFTELYCNMLYSPNYFEWEQKQRANCEYIITNKSQSQKEFEPDIFRFRNKVYPLFDLWGLSAKHLLNCDEYKQECINNEWCTKSGKYFKTSAETTYRFIMGDNNFDEAHMAIEDSEIESKIFSEMHKKSKGKWEMGIIYFPFRILGKVEDF